MAKARAILNRRKAVQNIRKITRTMQLISTARFQRAFNRATAFKPYSEKITAMVANVAQYAQIDHPLLRQADKPGRVAILVITANRGLCGGYNSQVLHTALPFVDQHRQEDRKIQLGVVGKKGLGYLRFLNRRIDKPYLLGDSPTYRQTQEIAEQYMTEFTEGQIDAVHVVYIRFHSSSRQTPHVLQLLPFSPPESTEQQQPTLEAYRSYEFTPPAHELLTELLPEAVKVTLYQCFMDAVVSEHVARMVAMKAATDNAEEMIKHLTRQANRARQAQITSELSELMAGSEEQ